MKSYCDSVIPGTLRYVNNTVSGSIAYDAGFELIISRCSSETSRCLSVYDHGDCAGTVAVEDTVNSTNAVWRAETLLNVR